MRTGKAFDAKILDTNPVYSNAISIGEDETALLVVVVDPTETAIVSLEYQGLIINETKDVDEQWVTFPVDILGTDTYTQDLVDTNLQPPNTAGEYGHYKILRIATPWPYVRVKLTASTATDEKVRVFWSSRRGDVRVIQ